MTQSLGLNLILVLTWTSNLSKSTQSPYLESYTMTPMIIETILADGTQKTY